MECPSCHSEMPDDSRFCDVCGGALPGCCPSCSATNRAGARFCSKCGKTLAADSLVASDRPATVAAQPASSAERRSLRLCSATSSAPPHFPQGSTPRTGLVRNREATHVSRRKR
jgi:hypothetical protein